MEKNYAVFEYEPYEGYDPTYFASESEAFAYAEGLEKAIVVKVLHRN